MKAEHFVMRRNARRHHGELGGEMSVEDDGVAHGAHPRGSLGEEYWGV
jgi:hypothetical protein